MGFNDGQCSEGTAASTEALLQALGETGNSQKSAVIDNKVDPAFLTEDVAREMAVKLQRSIEDSLILQKIMAKSLTNPNLEVNQAESASRSDAPEAAERAYAEAKAET